MAQNNRTLICLAAKRSGTTAIHRIFVKHPQVKIIYPDQQARNNEPNFWNFAAAALNRPLEAVNDKQTAHERFIEQVHMIGPDVTVPDILTENSTFDLWDRIVEHYGGLVFDKSPRYLEFDETLDLLKRYKDSGRDVRFFGIMRAPWDTISSQFELWEDVFKEGTPEFRDTKWVEYYQRFEGLQSYYSGDDVPLLYYERVANDPLQYIPDLFTYCGIDDIPEAYSHFRPVSVGRYYRTEHPRLRAWQPSDKLLTFANQHGYELLSSDEQQQIRRQQSIQKWRKLAQRVYYKLRTFLPTQSK